MNTNLHATRAFRTTDPILGVRFLALPLLGIFLSRLELALVRRGVLRSEGDDHSGGNFSTP